MSTMERLDAIAAQREARVGEPAYERFRSVVLGALLIGTMVLAVTALSDVLLPWLNAIAGDDVPPFEPRTFRTVAASFFLLVAVPLCAALVLGLCETVGNYAKTALRAARTPK